MYNNDPDVKILYSHSPVQVEVDENTSFAINKEGRITITVKDGDEFDEVNVPASLIYKIMSMIKNTQKRKRMSKEEYINTIKGIKE